MPQTITTADVPTLVTGVNVLGCGGGGDAASFASMLRHTLGPTGTVTWHDADHTPHPTDPVVVPVGVVGAVNVLSEKLPNGHEFREAITAVTRWTGGPTPDALMAAEAGGPNALTVLLAALDLGLPVIDVDLMGRALPRLDQLSWAVRGLPVTPCALAEPGGQILVVDRTDARGLERTVRAFLAGAGGWAALALAPVRLGAVRDACVHGSLTRALGIGRAHATLPPRPARADVAAALGCRVLAAGRIREVARSEAPGFGRGSITVVDAASGAVVRLETENEILLALSDGEVTATVPDVICLLDRRTALPVAIDRIRPGQEVIAATLPGPEFWRDPGTRPHVSPRAFGLDTEAVDSEAVAR
ncbi:MULTISPECIES: DUF917 domain-containing protein [unclassified Streptomyces]|uniref:DUF917 domain-containing protein n=1 Tax=unclassified Streptomyces TaxID=2593676 RepID=UPI00278BF2E9|nr:MULTISPECIES: DUF917 domain-containing protein [unclassified Streptomyces]